MGLENNIPDKGEEEKKDNNLDQTINPQSKILKPKPKPQLVQGYSGGGGGGDGISMSDVRNHNRSNNAWTTIGGRVYDLSNFVNSHPGGYSAIMRAVG